MIFIELLKKCDVEKVREHWDRIYKNLFEYDKYESDFIPEYIEGLLKVTPADSEFKMIIQKEKMLSGDENIVVNGTKEGDEQRYGLDFSPDAEWVGLEVTIDDELKELDTDEIVCHVIWEMSFYGNDEAKENQLTEIKRRSAEVDKWIEEGTLDQHTSTMEEVMERIKEKHGELGKDES